MTLSCIAYGVEFRLTSYSGAMLDRMRAAAPLSTEPIPASERATPNFTLQTSSHSHRCCLLLDDEIVLEGTDLPSAIEQLGRALMLLVADHAPERVFLHAGVIGWQGHALVLPGTSFAGKTTLVAELVRAGATYYSDEYAVLDKRGLVHPYARDLQMRQPGRPDQTPTSVQKLNGTAGICPLPVSHIVFSEYMELADWNPQPVSAGMAALEMLRHAIPVQRTPARVMATFAKMMEDAVAFRSMRGEATEAAAWLLNDMTHRASVPAL